MREEIYVVTGASGNIGKSLTEILLRNGHKVRVVGRSRERLQPLIDQGAQATFGKLEDSVFLTEAFDGAKSIFAMIPPNLGAENLRKHQGEISDSLLEAIRNSGVRNVVALSSLGAHLPGGTGPIKGMFDFEQKLDKLEGVNVLILRPGYYMENLFRGIPIIRKSGVNDGALDPELAIPMIAKSDIAEYAAKAMVNLSFKGITAQVLLGPSDVTMTEATLAIGKVVDIPSLSYKRITDESLKQSLSGIGATEDVVNEFIELTEWINKGSVGNLTRTEESTTKTTIDEFVETFGVKFRATENPVAGNN